ncbi:hypothetical protein SLEP1_g51487 [Rubroshorea leprosula]|uniref:non-specific serine/threonine protein kinase n=1 Tax=Rubroshorea leprosula TaxID=152421 RepID=A0AAV5M454_9ROSI|nr:hypothetical protein SLEP1_g51487 [Rubroshorea leprosula]
MTKSMEKGMAKKMVKMMKTMVKINGDMMMLEDEGFKDFVQEKWGNYDTKGWGGYKLKENLKRLKKDLKIWNKEVFGLIEENMEKIREEITILDERGERVSILVNGSPMKEFHMSKGLRQRDPLAPFLFLLVAEASNGLTEKAVEEDQIKGSELQEMADKLNCVVGSLPFRYLGVVVGADRQFHHANFAVKGGGPEMIADGIKYEAETSSLGIASFNVIDNEKGAVSNAGLFSDRNFEAYRQNSLEPVRNCCSFFKQRNGENREEDEKQSISSAACLVPWQLYSMLGPLAALQPLCSLAFCTLLLPCFGAALPSFHFAATCAALPSSFAAILCSFHFHLLLLLQLEHHSSNRNTNSPERYQTSRISPGSLRYYGLGLENGHTDFDISKEAGGFERAITKNFNATVTENYLEIHLFWAGKGTCCIPSSVHGPSISATNVVSSTAKGNGTGLIVSVAVPVGVVTFILMLIFVVFYLTRRKDVDEENFIPTSLEFVELLGTAPGPNTYSYAELRAATDDFSPSNKLGERGFSPVYRGKLSDGRVVAAKQLSVASHQGKSQFVTEIATISAVQYRNLVKLYGCYIEGKRCLLVYEYLENKSLDQALFATARGLAYLHEESRLRIVHRDMKASNILLDSELCPKKSDFGLAKLYDDKKTHISTRVAGTIGYLGPEYAMRGHLTEKADVFSFGVVTLEILSGRPNSNNSQDKDKIYLIKWAWTMYESNQSLGLVDPTLVEFDANEAIRMIKLGLLCTQASPIMRPPMSRVAAMLAGDNKIKNNLNLGIELVPSPLNITEFSDIIGEGR